MDYVHRVYARGEPRPVMPGDRPLGSTRTLNPRSAGATGGQLLHSLAALVWAARNTCGATL